MRSLSWYRNRLASMSPAEIGFRIVTHLKALYHRAGFGRAKPPTPSPGIAATRWISSKRQRYAIPVATAAGEILDNGVSVFDKALSSSIDSPNWNRDPKTGVQAPMGQGATIDVHSVDTVGDIKYLWELNRHLHLPALALAFEETGQDRFHSALGNHLSTWLEQCPYQLGPNWNSSLELSIRLINWSIVSQSVDAREESDLHYSSDSSLHSSWLRSIYQHVHFVNGHYSQYSSANNHLTGEAAGVYIATCTWPYWGDFDKWRRRAKNLLIGAATAQVGPDGVNREQAIGYLPFVLDFFIMAGLAGRASNDEFPDHYWQNIENMLNFVHSIIDVGGNLPMFGDADDGVVIRSPGSSNSCPYRSLLATGAILFNRSDFAEKSGGLDDKTRLLLGESDWNRLFDNGYAQSTSPQRVFPDGGYYILGQDIGTSSETRMTVDAGPLGYLSIAAHGHADALSFILSVAGSEFLIDPGTYCYGSEPDWRSWFRSTRAHNTITVDGQDQSVQGGTFMWQQHATARCLSIELSDEQDHFVGEHDGYERLGDPVTHRREIRRTGSTFEIRDTLNCNGSHDIELWLHFAQKCRVDIDGEVISAENAGHKIRITPNSGSISCYRGNDYPKAGWVSRHFGEKQATNAVCITHTIAGTTELTMTIECKV